MDEGEKRPRAPDRRLVRVPNGALLAIECLALFAVLAAAWRERSALPLAWAPLRELRLTGWMAASLFSAPLANAAMVCVAHALDIDRYRFTFGGFLLFALFAMAVFFMLVIARALRHAMGAFSKRS